MGMEVTPSLFQEGFLRWLITPEKSICKEEKSKSIVFPFFWKRVLHPKDRKKTFSVFKKALVKQGSFEIEHRIRNKEGEYIWYYSYGVFKKSHLKWRCSGGSVKIHDRVLNEEIFRKDLEQKLEVQIEKNQEIAENLFCSIYQLGETELRERKKIAEILHDHIQQLLAIANIHLGILEKRQPECKTFPDFTKAKSFLEQAVQAARAISADLNPIILQRKGLIAALKGFFLLILEQYKFTVDFQAKSISEPENDMIKIMIFLSIRDLIWNAVRHSGEKRCILLIEPYKSEWLHIMVKDQGKGAEIKNVFDKTGSSGLFRVKNRVSVLNGEMVVDSLPGQGTTVHLFIPAYLSERLLGLINHVDFPEPPPSIGPAKIIKIILIKEGIVLRKSLFNLLNSHPNIKVVAAVKSAEEAIQKAITMVPDLVILDLQLKMSSLDDARMIRNHSSQIKIIGLTVAETIWEPDALRGAGITEVISKSSGPEVIFRKIFSVFEMR